MDENGMTQFSREEDKHAVSDENKEKNEICAIKVYNKKAGDNNEARSRDSFISSSFTKESQRIQFQPQQIEMESDHVDTNTISVTSNLHKTINSDIIIIEYISNFLNKYRRCYKICHTILLILRLIFCILNILLAINNIISTAREDPWFEDKTNLLISACLISYFFADATVEIIVESYIHSKFYQDRFAFRKLLSSDTLLKFEDIIFDGYSVTGEVKLEKCNEWCSDGLIERCRCCWACTHDADSCCCYRCSTTMRNSQLLGLCVCCSCDNQASRYCIFNRCLCFWCCETTEDVKRDGVLAQYCWWSCQKIGPNSQECCCGCYFYENQTAYIDDVFKTEYEGVTLESYNNFEERFLNRYAEIDDRRSCSILNLFACIPKNLFFVVYYLIKFFPLIRALIIGANNILEIRKESNKFAYNNKELTYALCALSISAATFAIIPLVFECCMYKGCCPEPVLIETLTKIKASLLVEENYSSDKISPVLTPTRT